MKKIILLGFLSLALAGCQASQTNISNNKPANESAQNSNININQNQPMPTAPTPSVSQAIIKTTLGDITVQFYGEDSPATVANFVKLAQAGFYDGTKFHRVIKGFMIQAGDPLSKDDSLTSRWGTGGPGYEFADEINSHKLVKGSLAMANSGLDTNGSQFFIVTAANTSWLDGKHTNFGEVIAGLDIVSKIENVAIEGPDRPAEDVLIESIELQ